MKARQRVKKFTAVFLTLAMLLSACGSQEPSGGEPEVKDTLIVGNSAEPTVLDPPNQQNTPAGLINVQVYDGLLRQNNETGEIEPCLAESWEYVDDCTVRFHLRDDVYFHDGSKFTAEDVKKHAKNGPTLLVRSFTSPEDIEGYSSHSTPPRPK